MIMVKKENGLLFHIVKKVYFAFHVSCSTTLYIIANTVKSIHRYWVFQLEKKQYEVVLMREKTDSHLNAKVAEVLILQEKTIASSLKHQTEIGERQRKAHVVQNRNVLLRIIVAISFLGKQGMAFRDHRESMVDQFLNDGNFLEALKFLSSYNSTIYNHLEEAKESQLTSSTKVGGKRYAKGRGSIMAISRRGTLEGGIGNVEWWGTENGSLFRNDFYT